jgi:hypothetical protein
MLSIIGTDLPVVQLHCKQVQIKHLCRARRLLICSGRNRQSCGGGGSCPSTPALCAGRLIRKASMIEAQGCYQAVCLSTACTCSTHSLLQVTHLPCTHCTHMHATSGCWTITHVVQKAIGNAPTAQARAAHICVQSWRVSRFLLEKTGKCVGAKFAARLHLSCTWQTLPGMSPQARPQGFCVFSAHH